MALSIIAAGMLALHPAGADHHDHEGHGERRATLPDLPPGSNERLRELLSGVEGIEVIISDVVIPPNAQVPRHFHPGEEFLYVLEGSAVHVEEGKPDRILKAGDAYVIPPRAIHSPRGGPFGTRGIVFRVHVEGEPERILVDKDGKVFEH